MSPQNSGYLSHLSDAALFALSESQRTIIAMHEQFEDIYQAKPFLISLVHILKYENHRAANVALGAIYAVCGLKISSDFNKFIRSDCSKHLLSYYAHFLTDLYNEAIERRGASETNPHGVSENDKILFFPSFRRGVMSDDEHICILCRGLRSFYDDSYSSP